MTLRPPFNSLQQRKTPLPAHRPTARKPHPQARLYHIKHPPPPPPLPPTYILPPIKQKPITVFTLYYPPGGSLLRLAPIIKITMHGIYRHSTTPPADGSYYLQRTKRTNALPPWIPFCPFLLPSLSLLPSLRLSSAAFLRRRGIISGSTFLDSVTQQQHRHHSGRRILSLAKHSFMQSTAY
jgi:hypothetical protein